MIELGRMTELQPGVFVTTLDMCTTAVLPSVLMPDVPYVWVVDHWPAQFGWWDGPLPLVKDGRSHRLRVRDLQYDVFLEREPLHGAAAERLAA